MQILHLVYPSSNTLLGWMFYSLLFSMPEAHGAMEVSVVCQQ